MSAFRAGDRIVKTGQGWKLDVVPDNIDAYRFDQLYRSGRDLIEKNPEAAGEALREAMPMWRGHPYSGVEGYGLLDGETRRLTELTIDPDQLMASARQRLTRSFTESECSTYEIDPCPTLEELKSS